MWNRKKEEDIPARPSTPSQSYAESQRESLPMSTQPVRSMEYGTRAAATLGKTLVVHGRIQGKEDLLIDGRLEGDVDLPENRLTVGASGHVQGGIRAREIVILGSVQGNLEASDRVEIKKNARVVGDLRAARPVIEDEAYFKGSVETIRVEAPKPAPKPQPVEAQPNLISGTESKTEPRKG